MHRKIILCVGFDCENMYGCTLGMPVIVLSEAIRTSVPCMPLAYVNLYHAGCRRYSMMLFLRISCTLPHSFCIYYIALMGTATHLFTPTLCQYDYQASTRSIGPGFELYSQAEKKLAKEGVKSKDMLSTLLKQKNSPVAVDLLSKSQFSFFVPPKCALRDLKDEHATTRLKVPNNSKKKAILYAVVFQNLARVELVVTTDKLDTLVPQINRYGMRMNITRANPSRHGNREPTLFA